LVPMVAGWLREGRTAPYGYGRSRMIKSPRPAWWKSFWRRRSGRSVFRRTAGFCTWGTAIQRVLAWNVQPWNEEPGIMQPGIKAPSSAAKPPGVISGGPNADLTGQTLGDFHVIRRLGDGGMGHVYLAEQISLKRKVALKILKGELADSPTSLKRFKAEAEAVA